MLGVRETNLRKELLKINLEDVEYDVVVKRALNYEAIQKGFLSSLAPSEKHVEVKDAPTPMSVDAINSKTQCSHCAKRHGESKCRFLNATCFKCHKKGHTRAACKMKNENRVQSCEDGKGSLDCEDNFGVRIHGVAGGEDAAAAEPMMVEVIVNSVPLRMEVDSGSARTIIPHSLYMRHENAFPGPLLPFEKKLVTWKNSELEVLGREMVNVQYGERNVKLPIVVSHGDTVLMRLYNTDKKWQRGKIICSREPSVYEVEAEGGDRHRRHVDQLLRTRPPYPGNDDASEQSNDSEDYDIVIPPPEEWNEIIGC
ncbi:polyprotein [Operophtera brumata]|uniref:Polyprotein n=1 Tax=Operophtera brumata TaxID=104452 RepID=A0A0L7LCE0_OPEBR|nr:polyprotein [Operophtera brumata]